MSSMACVATWFQTHIEDRLEDIIHTICLVNALRCFPESQEAIVVNILWLSLHSSATCLICSSEQSSQYAPPAEK